MEEEQQIQAQTPDGVIHQFPAGTSQSVIDSSIQQYLASKPKVPAITDTNPGSKGISPSTNQVIPDQPQQGYDFEKILRTALSGAAGVGAGVLSDNPLVGSAAMSGSDYVMRKLMGEPDEAPGFGPIDKNTVSSPVARGVLDVGSNTLVNEGLGKILSLVGSLGKSGMSVVQEMDAGDKTKIIPKIPLVGNDFAPSFGNLADLRDSILGKLGIGAQVGKGSVAYAGISDLGGTYSQYPGAKGKPVAEFIENYLTKQAKQNALDTSASLTYDKAQNTARNIGTMPSVPFNLENTAESLVGKTQRDYQRAQIVASKNAESVKAIAQANQIQISTPTPPTISTIVGSNGQPIVTPGQPKVTTINGPIDLSNTGQKILDLEDTMAKSLYKPDPDSPLMQALSTLKNNLGYKVENGQAQFTSKVVPFEDAWATKKALGADAFDTSNEALPDNVKRQLKQLYHSMDDDIEGSIATWQNGGKDALANYQNSKNITNQVYDNFFTDSAIGGKTGLLNLNTDAAPAVRPLYQDAGKLQRFLNTGELKLPDGTTVTASNKRSDMQSFVFGDLFNEAWKPLDANEVSQGVTNTGKLKAAWNDYANSPAGQKLYSVQQRQDIGDFINDASDVNTTTGNRSKMFVLRGAGAGAFLAAGLAGAMLGGGTLSSGMMADAGLIGGAISLHEVGKLLTNPETARLLIAMQKGGPLGMSTQMAARFIGNALKNQPFTIQLQDGKTLNAKFGPDGKITTGVGDQYSVKGQPQ